MFNKLAAEALGISDIGVIVGPAEYSKVDADDYLFKLNIAPGAGSLVSQYGELLAALNTAMLDTHTKRDFSDVFVKYIHN